MVAKSLVAVLSGLAIGLSAGIAFGQEKKIGGQVGEMSLSPDDVGLFKKPCYSPYSGRRFPTQVFWGDTPRGEEVTSSHGMRLKLSRPLDWLVIADHSEGMGAMNEIVDGNPQLLGDPTVNDWSWTTCVMDGSSRGFQADREPHAPRLLLMALSGHFARRN